MSSNNSLRQSSAIAVTAVVATAVSYWFYGNRKSSFSFKNNSKQIAATSKTHKSTEPYSSKVDESTMSCSGSSVSQKENATVVKSRQTPKKTEIVSAKKIRRATVPTSNQTTHSIQRRPPLGSISHNNDQKTQGKAPAATKNSNTKSATKIKKRIRVRDSLLPEQLRQNIQASRAAATALSSSGKETTASPVMRRAQPGQQSRKQKIRVRDSLLPVSIRERKQRTQQREEDFINKNAKQHKTLPIISSSKAAATTQPISPTASVSFSASSKRVRTPKKLTPTRRNVFEGKQVVSNSSEQGYLR